MADKIANKFRLLGENKSSVPVQYFTKTEELVVLEHRGLRIQNDPRKFLKSLEKQNLIETWKAASPKQSEWFSLHPTQILNHAKSVWVNAISMGDGGMWLPTNHRSFYGDTSDFQRQSCLLCSMGKSEDIRHTILICPALECPKTEAT